ncbi:YkoF family thiamine/hydroxymethylpyrimidine-binding protein [Wukongibacter sp. M2B1]|uniref:YkoF family thiamine/hydroxymethylpyrimidine-binding protein n=1 Tax=Wukongibacter sp. M2B1 TaxID=3088895 RepID=UPI003D79D086
MCSMEKIASCEICYIPIISKDYIEDVNKVIEIIKAYKLEYTVGILSTTIRGNKENIFSLIKEIYDKMDEVSSFTMDIKISNICGCSK